MNTERPENDDAAREPEETGPQRAKAEEATAEGAKAEEATTQGHKAEEATTEGAEVPEVRAEETRADGTRAEDARARVEATQAEEAGVPEKLGRPGAPAASGAETPPVSGGGTPPASDAGVPPISDAVSATDPADRGKPTVSGAGKPAGSGRNAGEQPTATDADADEAPAVAVSGPDGHVSDPDAQVSGPDEQVAPDEQVVGSAVGEGPPGGPRRRSPVLIASVAAAVLLVGGGGAYLTSSAFGGSGGGAGSGSPAGDGTPAALLLDDYSAGTSAGTSGSADTSQSGTNGIAPGEPNPYGVTYTADGTLPDGPGSAPVYWAKGEVTKDEVARLAKALGAEGTPVADGAAWKVGAGNDGSGPVLRVNRQAPGMWTFTRYAPGTDNCTGATDKCAGVSVVPAGDPVSEAAAKKAAAPVLKAIGQDGAEVDATQVMGTQRVVNADPVIGALPTYGWTTGISVDAQGEVVGGNGQLEAPVKGDTYPLLSAREALDALNAAPGTDHRMGIGGCASPVPLKDRLESPCGSSTAAPKAQTAAVEDAVLGLAPHTSGGQQVLVPSWLFEVKASGTADSYTVTQPAVEPSYLKSATTPAPAPTPTASSGKRDVQVDGYTAEGKELTVSFTGGVCADYKATAAASGDEVKVTVTETPWPDKICILIAKEYHRTVHLDESLGSRKVVGSDGGPIPLEKAGARLPQAQ
ncbi:hypothetical protein ACFWBB_22150 [Streptomyces sp. NPDC060000]|uniref:hypothetical protein n=1 Tax=Streptomyces sp. NPDC060000 TaxID=3347031 RepID=UPI0036C43A44